MTEYGYGPVTGHMGRIPNYGKNQANPMGNHEPPACIQNAMMTKDKKPFTYTPGGLDLSQIKTPSMARRMARQRSLEEHEQAYAGQAPGVSYHQQDGPAGPPPPPPPLKIPVPPPPPSLVIPAPTSKSPKPGSALGERPEIVIPENPIGMLRKTNSPYHWEAEQEQMQQMGSVPKFQDKVPSSLTIKMPPSTFFQQPPQSYTPQGQNFQRPNYSYDNQNQPESPIHRPEAQYANKFASPNVNGSPITRELLQRQDSQFNKSPQPFSGQSPISNGSSYSASPNDNWRQPETRDSAAGNINSPPTLQSNRSQFSPNINQYSPSNQNHSPQANAGPVYHTLPRAAPKQDNHANKKQNNNVISNYTREALQPQSPNVDSNDPYPWRTQTLNRNCEPENLQSIYHNSRPINQQPKYTPPWVTDTKNKPSENNYNPPWKQDNDNVVNQQQQAKNSTCAQQNNNNNRAQDNYSPPWRSQHVENPTQASPSVQQNRPQEQPRYQSTVSMPVTPKNQNSQVEQNKKEPKKEVVYVNQEPVYFCPESPKSIPPWVASKKENTKTPPPAWCQKSLERQSAPRELVTPPRETYQDPDWVKKSNGMHRGVRETISPSKYQQQVQPTWSTRPSDNRKSLPRDNAPGSPGTRVIPIQIEASQGNQPPPLRIVIKMQQPGPGPAPSGQAPSSQPTQRIMRVLSPQLVSFDDGATQAGLPMLNRNFQSHQESQGSKERIIPIQIEGGSSGGANKSFDGRY